MSLSEKAIASVKEAFPKATISVRGNFNTVYSRIFLVGVTEPYSDTEAKVIVKHCTSQSQNEVKNEYDTLVTFRKSPKEQSISSPRPLNLDLPNKLIVMEYVSGRSLKEILLPMKPAEKRKFARTIDLAALGLAEFHRIFHDENGTHKIDSPYIDDTFDMETAENMLRECELTSLARSYIDYAAWNLIFDDQNDLRLFLIDLPGRRCVSTPHLDLAKFRLSLRVIDQYPQFRFLRMSWWDVESLFSRFLETYCRKVEKTPSNGDLALIDYLEVEHVRKLNSILESKRADARLLAESIYMRPFIKRMLRQKSIQSHLRPSANATESDLHVRR